MTPQKEIKLIRKQLVGYADRFSVAPGGTIQFKVSSLGPETYRADIVRIRCSNEKPDGAGFKEEEIDTPVSGEYPGRKQETHMGSFVSVPPSPKIGELTSFTLQALVWPTTPGGRRQGVKCEQAVISTWDEAALSGFALFLDSDGAAALRLGDGRGNAWSFTTGVALRERKWAFIAAAYDAPSGEIHLYQECSEIHPRLERRVEPIHTQENVDADRVVMNEGPLMMAAWRRGQSGGKLLRGAHFNGKIDSPRVAARALTREEMKAIVQWPAPPDLQSDVVAAWDFSREIPTDRVIDLSPNGLDGEAINLPTRAVTGYNWNATEFDWRHAPEHYGAIHFHDDDLYDSQWETDFELTVPETMRSAIYAARLRAGDAEDYIPFFVRPPKGKATAKLAFLASTATYMAYANSRLHFEGQGVELMRGRLTQLGPETLFIIEHPEVGLSQYDHHNDGSGVCYSSRLRPILDMRPKTRLWSLPADTHITDWLEHERIDYDVITDEDLHFEGAELLEPYRVVMTGSHPEYFSEAMLDALQSHAGRGGRLIYMGGNGFYWRTSFHPEKPGVTEMRRAEDGTRAWIARPGEYFHSFTGEYGGLWVRQGRPPNVLSGLGFSAQGFDISTYYRRGPAARDSRAAFIFEGIAEDELIGDFGINGGGAAGEEIDRFDRRLGSPAHALRLASSENHSACYMRTKEELLSNVPGTSGLESRGVRADLAFFETPGGGAVFSTGSIAFAGSLSHNDYTGNTSRMMRNVVGRFLESEPFEMPKP